MEYVLEFIKAFLPGFSISVVAGIVSVWIGLIFFWKWRKRDVIKRLEDLTHKLIEEDTKELRQSNRRHSVKISDMDKRIKVVEHSVNDFRPEIKQLSVKMDDIYKILIERGK